MYVTRLPCGPICYKVTTWSRANDITPLRCIQSFAQKAKKRKVHSKKKELSSAKMPKYHQIWKSMQFPLLINLLLRSVVFF